MRPAQAIRTGLARFFRFSGRASRSEYWWFLPVGISLPITALLIARAFASDLGYPALCIVFLVALVPLMAVTRRRLLDSGGAAVWFEAPLAALLWCLASGWALVSLSNWAFAAWDAGADGPAGFGIWIAWLLGNAILIPVFAQNFLVGFVTGIALFGQMAAPTKDSSDKPGSKRQR
ncbi:MAG: DUF805 domain-containing protein [Tabrizicola sp.]|nr:DUF805 domain-containing protein [Tabrizicola sp.]